MKLKGLLVSLTRLSIKLRRPRKSILPMSKWLHNTIFVYIMRALILILNAVYWGIGRQLKQVGKHLLATSFTYSTALSPAASMLFFPCVSSTGWPCRQGALKSLVLGWEAGFQCLESLQVDSACRWEPSMPTWAEWWLKGTICRPCAYLKSECAAMSTVAREALQAWQRRDVSPERKTDLTRRLMTYYSHFSDFFWDDKSRDDFVVLTRGLKCLSPCDSQVIHAPCKHINQSRLEVPPILQSSFQFATGLYSAK